MKVFTIPNFITLLNLVCGIVGIIETMEGRHENAGYLILMALVLDFLDGFIARLTKSYSDIGKQLDSLADMVSFGVLPSLMLYNLWDSSEWFVYISFLPALFSALRLAKFNIDERQGDTFYGIPTPANAMTVAAFPFILKDNEGLLSPHTIEIALGVYAVVISILMIADIPMMALKFKEFSWTNNKPKFLFLILSLGLLLLTKLVAIPLILILYVGFSLFSKS
ncbi:CDP-diacylglycerol--serine O-phosphatidyltransferase [Jiulongibacter sediminis]|uniref:CDP-diacylglycerol--serine O-phosphatidyltransferase n=1 Tax=Jiulongibacter sediminis TaxID=1605367 RepID=A0A0N8H9N4_9BACT|nr:CDP-diacylglycerol--serine O-phosphatidyltransferase [Jiulongibacter sediminis]KPM47860.1 hypothetical protein AFM12_11500 [Jiulongibacter sediminis]TBX24044.1 hypothetical protein TK44_11505 [Jiulongibacter sediminis]